MIRGRNSEESRLFKTLSARDQEQLLRFWGELLESERDLLVRDIRGVDFDLLERVKSLFGQEEKKSRKISPPPVIRLPLTEAEHAREREAREAGEDFLRASGTALFTAAGGQSSRLGVEAPKGIYPVTPVRGKSLFQVFAEKLRHAQRRYGTKFPWLIMVSDTNKNDTEQFFEKNSFFGLESGYVRFVEQGMFPAVDENGKVLLREKNRVFLSPTGHGGTFAALSDSGALGWLTELGIEEIFYFQVDNVLVNVLDPVFIGYHRLNGCEMSSKCVMKRDPGEKLGVFAVENGKTVVVEYSELATVETASGSFDPEQYKAGNIAVHLLNAQFCKSEASGAAGGTLPLHVAHKAIPHLGPVGERVEPVKPNGYKFETFIFDSLKNVSATIIMEVRREEEFSPLKNKMGEDSPKTVLMDQVRLFAGWLERAGVRIPRAEDGSPLYRLEISPLFAPGEKELLKKIDRNLSVSGDTYIE